jgi:hypothetical protein
VWRRGDERVLVIKDVLLSDFTTKAKVLPDVCGRLKGIALVNRCTSPNRHQPSEQTNNWQGGEDGKLG